LKRKMPTKRLVSIESLQNNEDGTLALPPLPPLPQLDLQPGAVNPESFAEDCSSALAQPSSSESAAAASGRKRGKYKTFFDRVNELKAYKERVRLDPRGTTVSLPVMFVLTTLILLSLDHDCKSTATST